MEGSGVRECTFRGEVRVQGQRAGSVGCIFAWCRDGGLELRARAAVVRGSGFGVWGLKVDALLDHALHCPFRLKTRSGVEAFCGYFEGSGSRVQGVRVKGVGLKVWDACGCCKG